MRRFDFGLGLSHLNELFAFCWSCCKMQKWRSLVPAALTAQFWSHEPQAAVDSSCLSLSLSLWDFHAVNPENRTRQKRWTSSMFRCSCWELNPSYAVYLLFLLCVCFFISPLHTNSGRLSDLVQSCEGSAGFRHPVTGFCLLSSIWQWS